MIAKVAKPARILVIDDSLAVRELIADFLSDAGYIVETANSAEEGWEMVCENPPDLIISDWSMRGLTGIELCRRIRSDPGLQHIYFLLLTAREDKEDLIQGLDSGADEFLSKPIHREELQARVRAGLRLRQLTLTLVEVNQQLHARNELLASMSLMDALTGVLNRRALETALPGLLQQVGDRQGEVFHESQYFLYYRYLSLWMIEIDNFKEIVRGFGQVVADQVLQIVARRLQSHCLPGSLLYRYSEREFVCITLGLDPTRALEFAETLRDSVGSHPIKLPSGQQLPVTVTLGGSLATPEKEQTMRRKSLMTNAEQALERAKIGGSNRCILLEETAA
jgi:diguanylate cyclase (GGDEF)-like protein